MSEESKLTLNSKVGDLIIAVGEVLKKSNGNSTTVELEIPDQQFYFEITIKPKEVTDDTEV